MCRPRRTRTPLPAPRPSVRAGIVLSPDGTPGFTDAATAGVAGAALLNTSVYVADTVLPAIGVDPATFVATSNRLTVQSGTVADLAPDTVVVTADAAQRFDQRVRRRLGEG